MVYEGFGATGAPWQEGRVSGGRGTMPAVHHRQGGQALLVPAGAPAVLPLSQQRCRVQEFGGGHGARGEEEGEEDGSASDSGGARGG
ncbi:hypothetical protein C0991_000557 [Blastosporella zonata]|nr:hypothetical protein C0991_000557 [Blastosporella zonata]